MERLEVQQKPSTIARASIAKAREREKAEEERRAKEAEEKAEEERASLTGEGKEQPDAVAGAAGPVVAGATETKMEDGAQSWAIMFDEVQQANYWCVGMGGDGGGG